MQRIPLTPRDNWQQKVESVGLTFHTPDVPEMDRPYWDESAAYQFTAAEIDTLEAAGNKLQEMCLAAAQHIIDEKRYAELDIPAFAIEAIEWAWNNEPPALYGRFDVSMGRSAIRQRPQTSRVQRRHPHLAPRSRRHPMVLAQGHAAERRLLQARPVQLHPRKTHRQVEGHRPLPLQAHLLRRARQPRRPAHHHLSPRHRAAGKSRHPPALPAGDRLERRPASLPRPRRTPHVLHLQALPLGGHAPGRVRPSRHRNLHRHPMDRAHLEDAPLQQRHPPHPLGALPQPRAPARSPLRRPRRPCATTSASP